MAKNGCIACNNSNIEAYLALLGYEIVKIVKKCAVISVKNTDDSKFVHYGVMNIETLEWVLEPQYHSYKNKNSLLQNNIIKADSLQLFGFSTLTICFIIKFYLPTFFLLFIFIF